MEKEQSCKKCKSKQEVDKIEYYKTEKGKDMMRCECKNCHSKIYRFAKKTKNENEISKDLPKVLMLKELKVV